MDSTDDLPRHLEELDQALSLLGDDVMTLGELDGLLAAVCISPEPISPEEWLPFLWTGEDVDEEALLANPDVPEVVARILTRRQEIADELTRGEGEFHPVYDFDGRTGEDLWEIWLEGLQKGMSLRVEAWEAVYAGGGEAADAFGLITTLIALAEGDEEAKAQLGAETVEALQATAHELLPECVEILAQAVGAARREPVRSLKIGRNDPCPCGSGKKYKKCCGAAA
jgi:uncharacterized protein